MINFRNPKSQVVELEEDGIVSNRVALEGEEEEREHVAVVWPNKYVMCNWNKYWYFMNYLCYEDIKLIYWTSVELWILNIIVPRGQKASSFSGKNKSMRTMIEYQLSQFYLNFPIWPYLWFRYSLVSVIRIKYDFYEVAKEKASGHQ